MEFRLTPEQMMIQRAAKEFAQREIEPIAAEVDREGRFPPDIIKKMGKVRLLGMICPRKYGGSEAGHLSCALACEQIAYPGSMISWMMLGSNCIAELISRYGTEEVAEKYVRPLCEGDAYATMAFTEAATGSDPGTITTTALPEGDHYILNGGKRFITYGAQDGPAVVWAKDDTEKLSAFVVEKNCDGYTTSKPLELMALTGQCVDVSLNNVRVPKENMLGNKGEAFDLLLEAIGSERDLQCASSVGLAQAALDEAIKYAKERIVGGRPLTAMQGIRWMLAEMASQTEACRWLSYMVAFSQEQGEDVRAKTALAKVFVVPTVTGVVGMALRIHGSYGYSKEFKIERLYRMAKGSEVMATSIELNESIVAAPLLR